MVRRGAVDRALSELVNLDVYALLGLDVDGYDTAPCPLKVLRTLRRPLQRVLGPEPLSRNVSLPDRTWGV